METLSASNILLDDQGKIWLVDAKVTPYKPKCGLDKLPLKKETIIYPVNSFKTAREDTKDADNLRMMTSGV